MDDNAGVNSEIDFIDEEDEQIFESPIYLLGVQTDCWKCSRVQPAVALAAYHVYGDLAVLSEITEMPAAVLEQIQSRRTRPYRLHLSRTSDVEYYTNFCDCGANFGDFFLHHEPGAGGFFVTSPREAETVAIWEIPLEGPFEIQCNFSIGPADLILEHGRRVE